MRGNYRSQPIGRPLFEQKAYRPDVAEPLKSQKKHFDAHHDSEIDRYAVMKGTETVQYQIQLLQSLDILHQAQKFEQYDFPRNLVTYDIPGALPQLKVTKHVPLKVTAERIGGNMNYSQDFGRKINATPIALDSLDQFRKEYESTTSQRDHNPLRNSYAGHPTHGGSITNRPYEHQSYPHHKHNLSEYQYPVTNRERVSSVPRFSGEEMPEYPQVQQNNAYQINPKPILNEGYSNHPGNAGQSSGNHHFDGKPQHSHSSEPNEQPMRQVYSQTPQPNPYYGVSQSQTLSPSKGGNSPDFKKIYTYNIIAHRPVPREVPQNTRLPYKYAMPVDPLKKLEMGNQHQPLPKPLYGNGIEQESNRKYPQT